MPKAVSMIYTEKMSQSATTAKGTIVLLTGVYLDYQKQLSDPLRVLLNNAGYGLTIVLGRSVPAKSFQSLMQNNSDVIYDLVKSVDVQGAVVVAPAVCRELSIDQTLTFMDGFGEIPTVCLGANVPGMDSLVLDNARGMTECMHHLIAAPENETFMFVGGRKENVDSIEREAIFRKSLESAGKNVDEELVIHCDFESTKTYYAVTELIPKRPDVDVIVCANDESAKGAIFALKALNIAVPGDIRVCGFDDTMEATALHPTISSVTQPYAEIAKIIYEILLDKIQNQNAPRTLTTIGTEFIPRESSRSANSQMAVNTVRLNDANEASQELAIAIMNRIRLPRMQSSIEPNVLQNALAEAAMGNTAVFESCVNTFLTVPKLSRHDVHWWQKLVVAIEDLSGKLPNSVYKETLQKSVDHQVHRIRHVMQTWTDHRRFQLHRSQQLNAELLANVSNSNSVEAIIRSVEAWLTGLKINRCFFALYTEYTESFGTGSRLIVNWVNGRAALPSENRKFETRELLPESLQEHLKKGLMLLLPIHSGGTQYGYMLVDPSDAGYFEYEFDAIGDRLGSAIRHLQQMQQMRKHSKELLRVNKDLSMLANYDELTELPNRAFFHRSLSQMVATTDVNGGEFAVLFLDLDGFKFVNDSLGHSAGDLLLQLVAARLAEVLSDEALISRLGGDEFTVVIGSDNDVLEVAKRASNDILKALAEPFELTQGSAYISASIGVALYPAHAKDRETLIRQADTAMYHAKKAGKGCCQIYTAEFDQELSRQIRQDQNMRRGFQNNEFHLMYEPKFQLSDSTIVGVEALLQWRPENSADEPTSMEDTVRIAERSGFMTQLDQYTIAESCAAVKRLHQAGIVLPISVNISASQLQKPDFVDYVASCLRENNLEPQWLEIEISESATMNDIELSISQFARLKEFGLNVVLDDVGTGYSSLNYLKRLPISTLRLGKAFLQGIELADEDTNPDVAIVKTIMVLGRSMNFKVTAEGIDNKAQKHLLYQLGCEEGQGSYLSIPLSESELMNDLGSDSADKAA